MTPWNVDTQISNCKEYFMDHSLMHELTMLLKSLHFISIERKTTSVSTKIRPNIDTNNLKGVIEASTAEFCERVSSVFGSVFSCPSHLLKYCDLSSTKLISSFVRQGC